MADESCGKKQLMKASENNCLLVRKMVDELRQITFHFDIDDKFIFVGCKENLFSQKKVSTQLHQQ